MMAEKKLLYLEISVSLCLLCYFSHVIKGAEKEALGAIFAAVGLFGYEISFDWASRF